MSSLTVPPTKSSLKLTRPQLKTELTGLRLRLAQLALEKLLGPPDLTIQEPKLPTEVNCSDSTTGKPLKNQEPDGIGPSFPNAKPLLVIVLLPNGLLQPISQEIVLDRTTRPTEIPSEPDLPPSHNGQAPIGIWSKNAQSPQPTQLINVELKL